MTRVAIVGGTRTPFVRAGGVFAGASFLDMGVHVVKALIDKLKLDPQAIDELCFSTVLLDPRVPNAARELVLKAGLPKTIGAHFVSNNCISGLVAVDYIAQSIRSGRVNCGLAGGSESMSRPTLTLRKKGEDFFLKLARAKSFAAKLGILASFRPSFLLPIPPSPKEPSTGLTMGQHCELSAQEFSIARNLQDEIALASHKNAARALENGYLAQEITEFLNVKQDNIIRADTSIEKLSNLQAVFERSNKGTITAGNASSLTDGASIVCLMSATEAKKQGREILGFLEAIEFAAIDPKDGLLMAPAIALPKVLAKTGLSVDAIDLFEIHEAFAAQVAANLLLWEKGWPKYEAKAIGKIPSEKINVNGGSIALGHPFAATGGRLIMSAVNELRRLKQKDGKQKKAAISVCAAGAMAAAVIISLEN
jgi:acetyl-CoA acetyltransferase family protein